VLTTEEKQTIKVMSAEGQSLRAIGRALGRSPNTVKAYLESSTEVSQEVAVIKQDLATLYESLAERMVTSIEDNDIKKLNALQRTIASATALDKMRLLRDQTTENHAVIISTLEEIRRLGREKNE